MRTSFSSLTPVGIYLHDANPGQLPAVWAYIPKQQDFHPIHVEGFAVRSLAETVVGLRSPVLWLKGGMKSAARNGIRQKLASRVQYLIVTSRCLPPSG
jgi:hypothetical protein